MREILARNAESLFWIGRYVERADGMARILDVTIHQLIEDTSKDANASARLLLRVLGIAIPANINQFDVFLLADIVAYNRTPGSASIADSIRHARENARGAREVTSSEMWECIHTTYNALAEQEKISRRLGPHEYLTYVKNRSAMFAGLTDCTLSRDIGYHFLLLGSSIERVDMTIRLLLSRSGDRIDSPIWMDVLRAAGAQDTYLRAYRGALDATRVTEFMLLDRLFPRSVYHALSLAEAYLQELENGPVSRVGVRGEAQYLLGMARNELEFLHPGKLLEELYPRLSSLQQICFEATEAISDQYFRVTPSLAWKDALSHDYDFLAQGE